jgi:large subunit ribosomal protein L2
MKLIKVKPVTNGSRHQIKIDKSSLVKNTRIFKNLTKVHKTANGRSTSNGRITSWHKGGGKKKLYRILNLTNEPKKAVVIGITYDPNRSSFISVNFNLETKQFYNSIATNQNFPGSLLMSNLSLPELKLGFRTQLKKIPIGTIVNNISQGANGCSKYVRSAGTSAQLIQLNDSYAKLKLPSNTIIRVAADSFANIGVVSNQKHNLTCLGKAGISRHLNRRPITRGIAMNPVDHPHGGRTNGGRPSVTPWGLPTKSKFYLKKRSKKKNYAKI